MKRLILGMLIVGYYAFTTCQAQNSKRILPSNENWNVHNRIERIENNVVHLNAQEKDGILWLEDHLFSNGKLEFDVKGKNIPGQSFVGIAFHGKDNETFDAIYFRPFNFKNAEKRTKSVQYISMPNNDWYSLRTKFPGVYENEIKPIPESEEDWFHVTLDIQYPEISVYVNRSDVPSLEVRQLSYQKEGLIGFWVGNNAEGWFKNLIIETHD